MAEIQDKDKWYEFLRPLVNRLFGWSYRHIQYVGKDNIPTDGAVILAPNHTNALCDALAILTISLEPVVFVARADMFKNSRAAWWLRWLKIMPIRRMRDGVQEVLHNDETEQKAINTLRDGVRFCILPEGTHRPKHSLLPLGKGIFRIALRANEEFGSQKPVYIVPVGLEYADYFHLWDALTVNIGKPINVTDFVRKAHAQYRQQHDEDMTDAQLILRMRENLTMRMRELIMWVPDDEQYDANWQQLRSNPPAPFSRFRKHEVPRAWVLLCLILLFPLALVSAVMSFPLGISTLIIRDKIKDPAFHNSIQFLMQFVLIPLMLFIPLPFWWIVQEYMYLVRQFNRSAGNRLTEI